MFDTVKGGDYLGDQDAIEVLCSEGPEVIRQLERMGVPWSRTPDGRPAQRSLGGAGFPRACYAADISGHVVLHTLYERALAPGCAFIPSGTWWNCWWKTAHWRDCWFTTWQPGGWKSSAAGWRCWPPAGMDGFFARPPTATPTPGTGRPSPTGRGVLADMEFVQFHPTTLYGTNILISEAARGEGGYLRNAAGERFMARYAPQKMELAPRDVVSRSIFQEIKEGRGLGDGYINLDLTHLGPDKILRQTAPDQRPGPSLRGGGPGPNADPDRARPALQHGRHPGQPGLRNQYPRAAGRRGNGECQRTRGQPPGRQLAAGNGGFRPPGGQAYGEGGGPPIPPPPNASLDQALARWRDNFGAGHAATAGRLGGRHPGRLNRTMTDKVGVFRTGEELREAVEEIAALRRRYESLRVPAGETSLQQPTHRTPGTGLPAGTQRDYRRGGLQAHREPRRPLPDGPPATG